MERKERNAHFVRLNGENHKLADMGIEFGITIMEDQDNLRSYSVNAWWRDNTQGEYPFDYTQESQLFGLSQMADAIDWIHRSLSEHISNRLERVIEQGREAQKFLASIDADQFVINGFRL